MEYKFEYKNNEERGIILEEHSDLVLCEEQNITEGNFLIFIDMNTAEQRLVDFKLKDRINTISNYANLDNSSIDEIENTIIIHETNLITGGL